MGVSITRAPEVGVSVTRRIIDATNNTNYHFPIERCFVDIGNINETPEAYNVFYQILRINK